MSEKVIQLILALHSKSSKKLIVQTKNPTDPVIQAVQSGNLVSFVRSELEDRKNLDYPPYKRFIKITHTGEKSDSVNAKEALLEVFSPYQPEIFGGFIGSSKNKYVTNMLIKIEPSKWSLPELSTGGTLDKNLLLKLLSLPSVFDIYIDPEDLL
jgi:primosomal protein N' (replication factor Y)